MRCWKKLRVLLLLGLAIATTKCSQDANTRKQKFLESGQRYFDKGKYREAAIQFSNAIQVDATYGTAHYQLAKTDLKLQQWGKAFQELDRVLDLEPSNLPARLDMANLLIAARDYKQAQEHTRILLEQDGKNPQVHLAQARLLAAEENPTGAEEEAQKAISLAGDQWEPYLTLANLQVKTNQPDEAEINFKKAAALGPKVMEAQLALGNYYQSRTRYDQAEEQFLLAENIDPANPAPCNALVGLYMVQDKRDLAESFLKQAIRRFPNNPLGYSMLGDFYFEAGDLDKAIGEYAGLHREHPGDIQVDKNYIQSLILANRLDDARKLNDELLSANPSDVDAVIDNAQIQIRSGHPDKAKVTLQTVINTDPSNGVAHYYLGLALEENGEWAQARTELQESVRLRPDLYSANHSLAELLARQGDLNGMDEIAARLIALQPGVPDGYLYRASFNMKEKRFPQAEEDIRKAIELAPQNTIGYIQMGNLRISQRQFAEASDSFQQALDRDPTSSNALAGLMNVFLIQNQPDKAVSAANAQIAKVGNSSAFYDLLGTVLFNSKRDVNGAETAFEKATALDGNDADAFLKLGQVEATKGSTDKAIATYLNSLKDHPKEIGFYLLLGQLYESQKDWEKAKKMYEGALEVQPGNPLASNNLAYDIMQTGGNVDLALDLAQTARRGMVDSPSAADTLGWAYYQKGSFKSAVDLFQEALRLCEQNRAPNDPNIYYHLAWAYEKLGQSSLARAQFQKVLRISPNYGDVAAVKKELALLSAGPRQRPQ